MTKVPFRPLGIATAREKLRKAEAVVGILREILADARPEPAHDAVLAWLKVSERAAFNRRLELDMLLRERHRQLTNGGLVPPLVVVERNFEPS